jgi:hypothetical protein
MIKSDADIAHRGQCVAGSLDLRQQQRFTINRYILQIADILSAIAARSIGANASNAARQPLTQISNSAGKFD